MVEPARGVVSVILVNYKGADDTIRAVQALGEGAWPTDRLEVIVVDNDSGDGSASRIREAAPWATVVEATANLGFAGGCNFGVAASRGEFVAFLNSDAEPEPDWIAAAVSEFDTDQKVGAVASRVLDLDGRLVDFIDAGLTWFGKGYKPFVGEVAGALGRRAKDVLFGTGAAMFVRRSVFEELGGFDERYFMFYEDVDFGWRLNLLGYRFRYQPASVARHRHHGTAGRFGAFKEHYLLERNALFTLYKNLEQERLEAVLPAALALGIRRAVAHSGLDSTSFDYTRGLEDGVSEQAVDRNLIASVFAVDQFVEHLPSLTASRDHIQATRRVSDRALWSLFGKVDSIDVEHESYAAGHAAIVNALPQVIEPPRARRVLVITGDPIGVKMAGPAIRAWHMASALAEQHEVRLLSLSATSEVVAPFEILRVRPGDNRAFAAHEAWADVIVFQGHAMNVFAAMQTTEKIVIADVYDPMHLEQLEQGRELPAATWDLQVEDATRVLNDQLARADFMMCASDRQRMFYLGQLAALGRINPANYVDDPDLTRLLAVVPFGIESENPEHHRDALKGVVPGIAKDDRVLLWGGGLYNWFDPHTLIRAVSQLESRRGGVRLYFLGTQHPHPNVPEMEIVRTSRELAAELGAANRSVFFNETWVEYADRKNYLTEADAGVSTHFDHVETTFSFRTRILDYLWAGLPMVVTDGDGFADLVREEGLGIVVPARDVDALEEALERVLFDEEFAAACRENVLRVRERFRWRQTLQPLVEFVADPRRAPDLAEQRIAAGSRAATPRTRRKAYGMRHNLDLVAHHLRHGGVRVVIRKIVARLRRG